MVRGKRLTTFVAAGGALVALAYAVLYGRVAAGDGGGCALLPVLLTGLGVAGGLAFNRVAGDAPAPVAIGAWLMCLAPLLAVWMFAALLPPLGAARAVPTALDIAFAVVILGGLFGAWGFARTEEGGREERVGAALFLAAGLGAIAALVSGLAGAVVAVSLALAAAAHAGALVIRWRGRTA